MEYPEVRLTQVKCMIDDMLYGWYSQEGIDHPEIQTLLKLSETHTVCKFIAPCGEIVGDVLIETGTSNLRFRVNPHMEYYSRR